MADNFDKYIKIKQKDQKLFIKDSFKTITISEAKGIKVIVGVLKDSKEEAKNIVSPQCHLFDENKWTVTRAKQWIESDSEKIKGWATGKFKEAAPNWMMYLSPPYAERIWAYSTHVVVKSVKLKKHLNELIWLCSDKVYGIYYLCAPTAYSLDDFDNIHWKHGISIEERVRWWPKADVLYVYDVWQFIRFDDPMKYRKPKGFQMFKEGNPSFIKDPDNPVQQVKMNITEDIKSLEIPDVLYNHKIIHSIAKRMTEGESVLDSEGVEISYEDLMGVHKTLAERMGAEGYIHESDIDADVSTDDVEDNEKESKETEDDDPANDIVFFDIIPD